MPRHSRRLRSVVRFALTSMFLGVVACTPTLEDFDANFPDTGPRPDGAADARDVLVLPDVRTCANPGQRCRSNDECCNRVCRLGESTCD